MLDGCGSHDQFTASENGVLRLDGGRSGISFLTINQREICDNFEQ